MEFKINKSSIIYHLSLLALLNFIYIGAAIFVIIKGNNNLKYLSLILLVVPLIFLYIIVRFPYKIFLNENYLLFEGIFYRRKLDINQLSKIYTDINGFFLHFKFKLNNKSIRIHIINRINNCHQLLIKIREINKNIIFIGC